MCYRIVPIALLVIISSCMMRAQRKSAAYYNKNQVLITHMLDSYEQLYNEQPFSIGYADRSYRYYIMYILTDTLRYIYNTRTGSDRLSELIHRFNYDTALLKDLALKMKQIKCLWLDKMSFYLDNKKDTATFLSFKSVLVEKPFVENKYYILLFLQHTPANPEIKARLKKGDLVRIKDTVYFMIGSHFR
jgi:hypothetical protein